MSTSTLQHRKQSAIAQRLPDPERQPQRFRDFDLEGKVFVVTGGGRGLGLTLAEVLVEAGGKGTWPRLMFILGSLYVRGREDPRTGRP